MASLAPIERARGSGAGLLPSVCNVVLSSEVLLSRWPAPPSDDPFATVSPRADRAVRASVHDPAGGPPLPVTAIVGFEDLRRAARDPATFSSDAPTRIPLPHETSVREYPQLPLESDAPMHGRYRAVLARSLDRRRIEALAPSITAEIAARVGAIGGYGGAEVVDELAVPAFAHALARVAGRPHDEERWRSWGKLVYTAEAANPEFDGYLEEVLTEIDRAPGDDAFGDIARARIDGRALTPTERRGLIGLFLAAGRDTTVDAIAGSLYVLGRSPGTWRRIVREPALLDTGVDELLRYVTPLPLIGRRVVRATTVGGVTLDAGAWAALAFRHANHDDRVFREPSRCVLDRRPNRHVAFGYGPHTCMGMHLALLVVRATLSAFARAGRTLAITDVTWEPWLDLGFGSIPRGIERLHLRVGDPVA